MSQSKQASLLWQTDHFLVLALPRPVLSPRNIVHGKQVVSCLRLVCASLTHQSYCVAFWLCCVPSVAVLVRYCFVTRWVSHYLLLVSVCVFVCTVAEVWTERVRVECLAWVAVCRRMCIVWVHTLHSNTVSYTYTRIQLHTHMHISHPSPTPVTALVTPAAGV